MAGLPRPRRTVIKLTDVGGEELPPVGGGGPFLKNDSCCFPYLETGRSLRRKIRSRDASPILHCNVAL